MILKKSLRVCIMISNLSRTETSDREGELDKSKILFIVPFSLSYASETLSKPQYQGHLSDFKLDKLLFDLTPSIMSQFTVPQKFRIQSVPLSSPGPISLNPFFQGIPKLVSMFIYFFSKFITFLMRLALKGGSLIGCQCRF